jgi:ABC-type Zn uptake system ZnuABC Zn-binding protein ZnuA
MPFLALLLVVLLLLFPGAAQARITVVASIPDLASIAASVGGDLVETSSVARPEVDVHRVEVLPSYMVRVSRARLYLKVGMDLDRWADLVIEGSRNSRLTLLDGSRGILVLEKPTGRVDASMGDVHPAGNPHYWLDPTQGVIVARRVADALAEIDPPHAAEYRARAESFAREAEARLASWVDSLASLPSRSIVTYHASWPYFARTLGLEVVGTVEPVPGIPPTARHLQQLVETIRSADVRVVLQEPYFSNESTEFLRREAGVRVVRASPSCASPEAGSYLAHFDELVQAIRSAP